ncbi:MAG: II family cellulose-binding protein [Fusobacteriia bacterium 4572_132]|nr:MAG: II family cellulose-binding protein [Fusobacteriia bacterium 4572_132]
MTLTTPALLFSALSLLLLAYTNRFLVIAQLIRDLHKKKIDNNNIIINGQIQNLRKRINLIKNMQFLGITSLFFSVFSMMLLFINQLFLGEILFGIGLVFLLASLFLSMLEIIISVKALNLELNQCNNKEIGENNEFIN